MALESIFEKRADAAYVPSNRGLWLKIKCLHREEFVVVSWTDPEGTRPRLGALLLAITIRTGASSMPAAPAPASPRRSSSGCGEGCSRLPTEGRTLERLGLRGTDAEQLPRTMEEGFS
jgi:ATP-dependent DNA ligase